MIQTFMTLVPKLLNRTNHPQQKNIIHKSKVNIGGMKTMINNNLLNKMNE